jgi:hypothetical protein
MNIFDPLISGSLSVSGSGHISGDLTVLGTINATISGTTSDAISASHAASYLLTSSFEQFTGSYTTGSFTGSFSGVLVGDGSGISGIPASGVTGLNLSQITDGSATASISDADGFRVNKNVEITGSLIVDGPITATEFFTQIVSSSIIYESGSTKFGDTQDDSHDFTGSVNITGSLKVDTIDLAGDKVVTISVSDFNGKYFIDNVQNPVLTFVKGFTYKFLFPNILSHPLRFSTTSDGTHGGGTIYTDGVTTGSTPNYIQIEVTESTPTTLYYFCTAHQNMGNSISVLSDILNVTSDRNVVYVEPSRIATTGSNVFEGDQVITGSVEVTGSITLNGQPIGTGKLDETTFNDYTSSNDDRVDSLEITSGSHGDRIVSLESTSGSHGDRIVSLESTSGSHNDRLDLMEISTGSLNSFTSSINTTIKNRLTAENVITGSVQVDITATTGYTAFSSSIATTDLTQENRLDSLETESGSIRDDFNDYTSSNDDRLDSLETESGSIRTDFNSYTGSNDDRVDSLESESGSIRNDFNSYTSSNDTTIGLLESTSGSHNDRLDAIEISTGSLNSFTSSINTTIKNRLNAEDVISGSIQVDITGTSGYTSFSSSIDSSISASVSNLSSSVVNYNDIQDDRLDTIESHYVTTGSNSFLGNQYITGSITVTDNLTVLGSSSIVYSTASQLIVEDNVIVVNSSFPAERFGGIEVHDSGSNGSVTASLFWDGLNNRWIYQNTSEAHYGGGMFIAGPRNTGSLGDEPELTSGKLPKSIGGDHIGDSIMNEDGSTIHITGSLSATETVYGTNITAIEVSTGSLNSYTSSLKVAIELTGSNLTVKGDLLVKGTTTNVNTTTLNVDNNLITLNGTGATSAGIRINDTTGPNLVSGSLLWDATNDYWIAGQLGSEQRIIRETEFSDLSTKVGNLETASGSIRTDFNSYTSSNDSTNTTQNSRLTSLESATGSYTTTDYFVTGATFGTGDGVITLTRNDGNTVTVDLDGRYLTGYAEVDTLATVTSRGAITTDKITITATGTANSPLLRLNATNAISFVHGLELMASGLTSTQTIILPIGVSGGTKNAGYIGYKYSGTAASNDNLLTFGHWGADHLMTMNGQGNVTITGTISASNLSGTNTGDQTNITGNAGTVTNGVYTNTTQTITGVKTFSGTNGGISLTNQNSTTELGMNIRPDSGKSGGISFTENAVADRWVMGIVNGDSSFYIKSGASWLGTGTTRFTLSSGGNLTVTGNISGANLSGTNTGDQTLSGLGGQPQLNGTGFVKANGTTISYDNSTYLTAESDTLATVTNRGSSTTGDISVTGGITVNGSLSRGTYITASNYVTGADNIVLKGNSSGVSGIFFESEKDGTNINHPSDFAFIQFHPYGIGGTSGEANRLVIGVSNDADDIIVLNPPDINGVKVRVGVGTTEYTVWHNGNLTNLNQLTNGPGYITGNQSISISGDATGSGTTSISLTVNSIQNRGFRNTGSNEGVNAQSLDSNGITYVTNVDGSSTNLTGNATDGALYSQVYSSDWQHQIYGDYRTGIMYVRGKNNNTWQSWKRVALSNATTFSNVSSVTFDHTLGTASLTAQVFDTNGDMFFPSNIRITSTQVIVTFSTNRSGRLVVTG